MARKDLQEFKADHEGGDVVQGGEVMDPTDAAGGPIQPRLGDVKAQVNPEADEVEEIAPGNAIVRESSSAGDALDSLFRRFQGQAWTGI